MPPQKKKNVLTNAEYEKEFDRLYLQFEELVFKTALRMTGDNDAAEDIRQSTFLVLHKKLEKAIRSGNVGSWLLTVVKQNVQHYKRTWARKFQYEVGLEQCAEIAARPSETKEDFLACLPDWVTKRDQDILVWYYYENLSLQEIAPKVHLTYGGMRVHMTRLMAKLRKSGVGQN